MRARGRRGERAWAMAGDHFVTRAAAPRSRIYAGSDAEIAAAYFASYTGCKIRIARERYAMQTVQLNVRMDAALKATGDVVAARCGWTPTQLVRALWDYLVSHDAPPAALRPALEQARFDEAPDSACADTPASAGSALVDGFFDRFGYPRPEVERLDYEALRCAAMREQCGDWALA